MNPYTRYHNSGSGIFCEFDDVLVYFLDNVTCIMHSVFEEIENSTFRPYLVYIGVDGEKSSGRMEGFAKKNSVNYGTEVEELPIHNP